MLTSGEFNKVLALLRRNREIYQETHRDDKIISGVYNKRASTHLVLGTSCNHGQSLRNVKEAATTQVVKEEKATAKPETKIIKFNEGQQPQPQQPQQPPTTPRGLAKPAPLGPRAVSPLSTPSASPSSAPSSSFKKEKVGTPVTQKSLIQIVEPSQGRKKEVTVWVYDNPKAVGSATHTLKVLVPEEGKILDVIVETRKIVSKDKAAEQGSSDPNDYNLYIAEDDGRPDDDIALGPTQDIKKLGREFVLVPKRRQTLSLTRSQTSIVKIQLPAGQYHTVAFQPDLKIKDLLFQVCTRWNLDATEHAFRVGARGHADVPVDITMKDLDTHTNGKNNLFLVKKDIKPEEEAPPEVPIWDRMGSITLKQYEVAKIKKFSKRQDRILGISGEMITNDSPAKKKGKLTKRPVRFIKDVKTVEQNKKKDNQFIIKFSDNKSYTYEARSPEIAREIVQKITTCMELKNNNSN